VASDATRESDVDGVDRDLRCWRQGDCFVGESWFAYRFAPDLPLTEAGSAAAEGGVDLADERVAGLVVVTQTCDIVKLCRARPFIEVSPLVEIDEDGLHEVERARRPAYAYLPRLADRRLVAHLDRVMTIEKPVVAKWRRTAGCSTDDESRRFARALARQRERPAFPDDFTELTRKLRDRLRAKHRNDSQEGRALRSLREIRVLAEPDWNSGRVRVTFWFIREAQGSSSGLNWADHLATWLQLVPSTRRFEVDGRVTSLADLTADDYVHSDPLDLDHLSLPTE